MEKKKKISFCIPSSSGSMRGERKEKGRAREREGVREKGALLREKKRERERGILHLAV